MTASLHASLGYKTRGGEFRGWKAELQFVPVPAGSIGPRPIALISLNDKIVGEVFASRLKGTPPDEAKGMAASADDNDKIELLKRTTIEDDGKDVEVVTLKLDVRSNVGRPWILHSLYFPLGESSTTFKLVVSESDFKTVMPYFETMLFRKENESERD